MAEGLEEPLKRKKEAFQADFLRIFPHIYDQHAAAHKIQDLILDERNRLAESVHTPNTEKLEILNIAELILKPLSAEPADTYKHAR